MFHRVSQNRSRPSMAHAQFPPLPDLLVGYMSIDIVKPGIRVLGVPDLPDIPSSKPQGIGPGFRARVSDDGAFPVYRDRPGRGATLPERISQLGQSLDHWMGREGYLGPRKGHHGAGITLVEFDRRTVASKVNCTRRTSSSFRRGSLNALARSIGRPLGHTRVPSGCRSKDRNVAGSMMSLASTAIRANSAMPSNRPRSPSSVGASWVPT